MFLSFNPIFFLKVHLPSIWYLLEALSEPKKHLLFYRDNSKFKTTMCLLRLLPLFFLCALACKSQQQTAGLYTAYTGATIIDGNGGTPIPDGVLLVRDGKVVAVGPKEDIPIPANVTRRDVSGKTIMPGIINAHGHVGDVQGIEGGHYSCLLYTSRCV